MSVGWRRRQRRCRCPSRCLLACLSLKSVNATETATKMWVEQREAQQAELTALYAVNSACCGVPPRPFRRSTSCRRSWTRLCAKLRRSGGCRSSWMRHYASWRSRSGYLRLRSGRRSRCMLDCRLQHGRQAAPGMPSLQPAPGVPGRRMYRLKHWRSCRQAQSEQADFQICGQRSRWLALLALFGLLRQC